MKATQEIKSKLDELQKELALIQQAKEKPGLRSVDYRALCQRECDINTKFFVLNKQFSSPEKEVVIQGKIQKKEKLLKQLNQQKKKYDPNGFSDLLKQISRAKVKKETLSWIVSW